MKRIAVTLALAGACSACQADSTTPQTVDLFAPAASTKLAAVATVGDRKIPTEYVERQATAPGNRRSARQLTDLAIAGEVAFEKARAAGYDNRDELVYLRKQLMVQRFLGDEIERKHAGETIAEDEVRAYFDSRKTQYFTPELRRVDHIVVVAEDEIADVRKGETMPEDYYEKARKVAVRLRQKLVDADFERKDVAELLEQLKLSEAESVPEGLLLHVDTNMVTPLRVHGQPGKDPFAFPALEERFCDAAFALKPRGLSEPIRTPFGYHIIFLREVKPEERTSFDDAKTDIRTLLAHEKQTAKVTELTAILMKKGRVEVDVDAVRGLATKADKK